MKDIARVTFAILIISSIFLQASAAQLTSSPVNYYRNNAGINTVEIPTGDNGVLVIRNLQPSAGTTVSAVQPLPPAAPSATRNNFSVIPRPDNIASFVSHAPYNASETGQWRITAMNGLDILDRDTNDIVGIGSLPMVTDLQISGNPLGPTFTWTLPATAEPYTQIRGRAFDDDTDEFLGNSQPVAINATSLTLPPGSLEPGRNYAFAIMLENMLAAEQNRAQMANIAGRRT